MFRRIINSTMMLLGLVIIALTSRCFDNSSGTSQSSSLTSSGKRFLPIDNFKISNVEDLQSFLTYSEDSYPLISAHRGGPNEADPENAIETFQKLANYGPIIIECDVRLSKDSVLVLMHDESLSRTTTGKGKVNAYTLKELKKVFLKDKSGQKTKLKIPTLEEALVWGRGKVIFCLDVKNDVPYTLLSDLIERTDAKHYSIVITYNATQARRLYNINPDLMISASVNSDDDFRRLIGLGIPDTKIIAFVGTSEPNVELVNLLHNHGIKIILGSIGNLDKQANKKGYQLYAKFVENGADIISTDYPLEAKKAIDHYIRKRKLSSAYINN